MASLVPEAWMEAQPASELTVSFVVPALEKLLLESCCQQACCHLSVETLGAAPGLRPGLLSFPNGLEILTASRLQGPGCPPTVTGYWLGPGRGASAGKRPHSPPLHSEASAVVPDRVLLRRALQPPSTCSR